MELACKMSEVERNPIQYNLTDHDRSPQIFLWCEETERFLHHHFLPSIKMLPPKKEIQRAIGKTVAYCSSTINYC